VLAQVDIAVAFRIYGKILASFDVFCVAVLWCVYLFCFIGMFIFIGG